MFFLENNKAYVYVDYLWEPNFSCTVKWNIYILIIYFCQARRHLWTSSWLLVYICGVRNISFVILELIFVRILGEYVVNIEKLTWMYKFTAVQFLFQMWSDKVLLSLILFQKKKKMQKLFYHFSLNIFAFL